MQYGQKGEEVCNAGSLAAMLEVLEATNDWPARYDRQKAQLLHQRQGPYQGEKNTSYVRTM